MNGHKHALVFLGLGFGAIAVAGCAHGKLVPGDTARVVSGTDGAAFVETDGVRCLAEVGAWTGHGEDLPDSVTPVKVRIKNSSGQPLRVLYQDFVLVGASGQKYHALPPLPLAADEQGPPPRVQPTYSSSSFFVAPRFGDAYSTLAPWAEPLPRDDGAYRSRYKEWGGHPVTATALRAGLPEGVLGDGGTVTGYLYFETPIGHESSVSFRAHLRRVDASREEEDGTEVASIKIPFRVE